MEEIKTVQTTLTGKYCRKIYMKNLEVSHQPRLINCKYEKGEKMKRRKKIKKKKTKLK